ncbi:MULTISPECIES: sulfite dehydrogenase [Paraburkholderia]|uniref:Sulfite dehydrogenase n=1 Tax=Paraburkholderia unamae TaxID=219649 RepID=A0ACC6REL6_9BURK
MPTNYRSSGSASRSKVPATRQPVDVDGWIEPKYLDTALHTLDLVHYWTPYDAAGKPWHAMTDNRSPLHAATVRPSRVHFLECSGNTASEWNGPSGLPVQFTHGLLSCCEWTGVRLSTLLDETGADPCARWLLAEGGDGAAMTRSLPLDRILDRALVVYAQNGEHLRPENGYPLRLIVPGFEGNTNIKWLRRLKLVSAPEMTREETSKYTSLLPNGCARQFVFEMDAKSVITRPSAGHRLSAHGYYPVSGYAWSGRGRIRRVDVSTDGGKTRREARLTSTVHDRALTRFEADWTWRGEPADLQSRAIDETGYVQPTREALVAARGLNTQYHYNGIQNWRVGTDGEVRNA